MITKLKPGKLENKKCFGDFCTFDYDKFERTYDPIKKPQGMEIMKMIQDNSLHDINKPTEQITINLVNAVRFNYEVASKILIENKLFPASLGHLAHKKNITEQDIEILFKYMKKPLQHDMPYSIR